jgi:hypothetical protein
MVLNLAEQLTTHYGRGWTRRNLLYMVSFAQAYPDFKIVHALSAQLSWTHFRVLPGIDDPLKRKNAGDVVFYFSNWYP